VSSGQRGEGPAQWLARVAAHDPAVLEPAPGPAADNIDLSRLDVRTHALVRLAALVAAGQGGDPATAYDQYVTTALDSGVTSDEIAGVLAALLPVAGTARVAAAAPLVLAALGRAIADCPDGR
jgi:4-carboxymuconolactone decarboxylase